MTVIKKVFKTRSEWEADRQSRPLLGSSDVGTIMGLNPYCTPFQYWHRIKSGEVEQSGYMRRGQLKEELIATLFEEATGEKVIKETAGYIAYHNDKYPDYVWVNPDRELFAKGRSDRPTLEAKDTMMSITQADMDNATNSEYTILKCWYVQNLFQNGVMERSLGYIAVENGNKELVWKGYPFDQAVFDHVMSFCCEWFERYILGDEIPEAETADDARILWPISEPKTLRVGEQVAEKVEALKSKKKSQKELSKEIELLEDEIKVLTEDNEAVEYNGATLFTYKSYETNRVDLEALRRDNAQLLEPYIKPTTYRKLMLK